MALRTSQGFVSFTPILRPVGEGFSPFCSPWIAPKRKSFPSISFRACSAGSDGVRKDVQAIEEAAKLKEELFRAIEEAKEGLDEKCLAAVASLEQLHQVPDIAAHPHLLKGRLVGLKANFKENRVDGKQRYLGFHGSPTTLGATSFNALKPSDLKIALYTGQQHVAMESPNSYVLFVDVEIGNPLGRDPLLGQIANRARFTISGPYSMEIEFISAEIKPKLPERDLDTWLQILKEANPDMDEHGAVCVSHQKPIKGRTDILYMDDEIRIHRGHKGGVSVLQLLKEPL